MSVPSPLDPAVVARLKTLSLRARTVVDGVLAGFHPSPQHGSSIEFAEHKQYMPGDDIRFLDWKALARFDRLYIKKYEDETDLKAYLVLDVSDSMAYSGDGTVTKFDYARTLAAAFLFLLHQQQDSAGMVFFTHRVTRHHSPRASGSLLTDGVKALEEARCEGKSDFAAALNELAQVVTGRCMIIVLTDLLDASESALQLLGQLRLRHHDVSLFHLLHRDEVSFPFDTLTRFEGMEDERFAIAEPAAMRHAYLQTVQAFIDATRQQSLSAGIDYRLCITDQPYDQVLVPFLKARMRR